MVFLLEDIAAIEKDRRTDLGIVENVTYVQASNDILHGTKTNKAIHDIIEPFVEAAKYYVWGGEVIGILGVFTDTFLNAGMWGNENIPGKKINVCLKYGALGSVIKFQDEGNGFDYHSEIQKLEKGEKHDFSHNGGGMRKFHGYQGFVAYHGCGNLISVATRVFSMEEFNKFSASGR